MWERLSMYLEEEERKKLGPTSYAYASSADGMGFKFLSLSRVYIIQDLVTFYIVHKNCK